MSLLRILDRKPSQVSMTINVAKVDAAQTAKTQLGLAAATNLSGEDTQPSVFSKEIATTKDPSLNPGTLKFEEDIAGGMGRHLGVFSCTMIMSALIFSLIHVSKLSMQCWSYHRNWNFFNPFLDHLLRWLCRCILDALGPRIFALLLWLIRMVGVWNHVPSLWRREGLLGSSVYETKVPGDLSLCNERDFIGVYFCQLHYLRE